MNRELLPPGWPQPKGYANGISARGTAVFVAGQVGWTPEQKLISADFVGQVRQALSNVMAILASAGATAEHLVRLNWYVTDKQEYIANLGAVGTVYRELIGRHYPAMTLVEVKSLLEGAAKVEIEATAVIPD